MIRLLVTGGTFDKTYDEITGTLSFRKTHVEEMLHLGRSSVPLTVETVMLIDSLQMTDDHRLTVARRCRECAETAIVITHGTDTMVETAAVLGRNVPGKTIVLTGAMVPYAFGSSDGLFNLGSALSFVQVLPAGVYIAMNGTHFSWDRVRKNRERGTFERVEPRWPHDTRG
jgi:L-asparaginase